MQPQIESRINALMSSAKQSEEEENFDAAILDYNSVIALSSERDNIVYEAIIAKANITPLGEDITLVINEYEIVFQSAYSTVDQKVSALQKIAGVHTTVEDFSKAEEYLDRALNIPQISNDKKAQLLLDKIIIDQSDENPKRAQQRLNDILDLTAISIDTKADCLDVRASIYQYNGEYQQQLLAYQQIIDLEGINPDKRYAAYLNKASLYEQYGELKKSKQLLESVVNSSDAPPHSIIQAHRQLSDLWLDKGKNKESLLQLKKAYFTKNIRNIDKVSLSPNIASHYNMEGHPEKALEILLPVVNHAAKYDDINFDLQVELARSYARQNRPAECIEALRQAQISGATVGDYITQRFLANDPCFDNMKTSSEYLSFYQELPTDLILERH